MKKYELKKCSAEFAWKERKEIKEGCTMYVRRGAGEARRI